MGDLFAEIPYVHSGLTWFILQHFHGWIDQENECTRSLDVRELTNCTHVPGATVF